MSLLLVPALLSWHAIDVAVDLPPGTWTTPWTAAHCTDRINLAGDGTAWCVNRQSRVAYHYQLATGAVIEQHHVNNAADVFASNSRVAWILLAGRRGLVQVTNGHAEMKRVVCPNNGVVTADDRLWYVDCAEYLRVYSGDGLPETVTPRDGLMSYMAVNVDVLPDQSMWVGTFGGVRRRHPQTGQWQIYRSSAGSEAAVTHVAAAPDGSIWFLQTYLLGSPRQELWLNGVHADGARSHVDLGTFVPNLVVLRGSLDSIAVDALGRVWFTGISSGRREKVLGIVNPNGTLAYPIFSLGCYCTAGCYCTPDPSFGVLPDGSGGIYLYNGLDEPLRHWSP